MRLRCSAPQENAHIIGVVVSETTIDTRMAVDSVTANSRNSRPTIPPMSRIGMNTAIERDADREHGEADLLGPLQRGRTGFIPASRCRVMFSMTTMASSTTKPVEIVSAISDRLSS